MRKESQRDKKSVREAKSRFSRFRQKLGRAHLPIGLFSQHGSLASSIESLQQPTSSISSSAAVRLVLTKGFQKADLQLLSLSWHRTGLIYVNCEHFSSENCSSGFETEANCTNNCVQIHFTFKRRIKSHLPFAGIIRSSPYSPRFQDKG